MDPIDTMVHSGGACLYMWVILVLLDHSTSTIISFCFFTFAQCTAKCCYMEPNIQQPLFVCSSEGEKLEKFCAANKFDEKSGSDLIDQMHLSRHHFSLFFLSFLSRQHLSPLLLFFQFFWGVAYKCQD